MPDTTFHWDGRLAEKTALLFWPLSLQYSRTKSLYLLFATKDIADLSKPRFARTCERADFMAELLAGSAEEIISIALQVFEDILHVY